MPRELRGVARLLQPIGGVSPASPAPTTAMRVPRGSAPRISGSASRPSSDAPTTVAPAPFRNLRQSSSSARRRSSPRPLRPRSQAVYAPFDPPRIRFTIPADSEASGNLRNPVRPREHREQRHERQVPRQNCAGTVECIDVVPVAPWEPRPGRGTSANVSSTVAATPRRPRTSGTSGISQSRNCGESTFPKAMKRRPPPPNIAPAGRRSRGRERTRSRARPASRAAHGEERGDRAVAGEFCEPCV